MREVWPRFKAEIFLDPGFPYPGELAYGYRKGLIDVQLLAKVIDGLARSGVPLVPEESEIALLLSDEVDQIRDLALQLCRYERDGAGGVWQYYFTVVAANEIRHSVEKFEILDSMWSDLGYPEGMAQIIYPQEGLPAHLYPTLGETALSEFIAGGGSALRQRDPRGRLLVGA